MGDKINIIKLIAGLMIVAGSLGLVYEVFRYTRVIDHPMLGPVEMVVEENHTRHTPGWAGMGALIVIGSVLFVLGNRKTWSAKVHW